MVASRCPECDMALTKDEADSGTCPVCGGTLPRHASRPVGAPHDNPEFEIPQGDNPDLDLRRGAVSGIWRKTNAGLIVILISTIIALPIWGLFGLIAVRDETGWAGFFIVILLVYTHPVLALAAFIGVCLCWTAPYPPAHKRAGISALLVIGAVVVLMPVVMVSALPSTPPDQIMVLLFGLPFLVVIGAIVYWHLFLVAVAACFRDPFLRKVSLLTLILTPALPITLALFLVIADIAVRLIFREGGLDGSWIARAFPFFSVCIIIGMNSALCIKTIRTIKRGTAAAS